MMVRDFQCASIPAGALSQLPQGLVPAMPVLSLTLFWETLPAARPGDQGLCPIAEGRIIFYLTLN